MRRRLNLWVSLVGFMFFLVLAGCMKSEPTCKMPQGVEPLSKQATFIESTSTGESMIRATGKGCDIESATLDAKRAALWFVLYSGDRPILKTPEEKAKAKPVVEEILKNPDQYIRWQSDVKDKKYEGAYVLLTYLFKVDVNGLKEKLQSAGVIKNVEEIAEEIGLPSIAVIPVQSNKEGIKTAITTFQEYLQDRDFEVFIPEAGAKVNEIVKKVTMLEGKVDPYYALALQLGSDVYVKVDVNVSKEYKYGQTFTKAVVMATAYETATGKQIGSSTGYSPERAVSLVDAVVEEAAHDAADKITSQIKKSWIKEAKKGKPFKVVVISSEENFSKVDEAMYFGVFKKLSRRPIKRLASGKNTISYLVYIKDIPNAYELFMKIKELYKGPGKVEKVMDAGSFLIIKVGAPEGEIIIE